MKKITLALLAAVLLGCIFAAGCVSPYYVYGEEKETTVSFTAGNTLTIAANGNPTTGYSWVVTESEGLTIVNEDYIQDEAESGMTGVGGKYLWEITAEEPGTYMFVAEYKRPWEDTYTDKMELTVIVT